jgi:hypothetical protein
MRAALVGLIVVATVGFVIGTSIERDNAQHESAAQLKAERAAPVTPSETSPATTTEGGGESAATHAAEGSSESGATPTATTTTENAGESPAAHAAEGGAANGAQHKELRPFGVDVEAVPFVVLAALASLALTALGWARPRWLLGLGAIAAAMFVFGVLDVREAFHQSDENQTGLVILAAVIAALHVAAAGCAAVMAARSAAAGAAPGGAMTA